MSFPGKAKPSKAAMAGMRPFPREKTVPIEEMKVNELRTLYQRNEEVLRTLYVLSLKMSLYELIYSIELRPRRRSLRRLKQTRRRFVNV